MRILTTPRFERAIKRLYPLEKKALDKAVNLIASKPDLGEMKKGDLAGVRVHKYKHHSQRWLLAYEIKDNTLVSLGHGSHENFYRDLKR